ncbi:MAG: endonuclease/exonuclease/phosphatase family protein [bacterium]
MKSNLIIVLMLVLLWETESNAQTNKTVFYAASWNFENLFDTLDNPITDDAQFLPEGEYKWTSERYYRKLENLSRVIRSMNEIYGPDILGIMEIEEKAALEDLLRLHFCDKNYGIAYSVSDDARGVDTGLLFNRNLFDTVKTESLKIIRSDGDKTRNILHVILTDQRSRLLHVFVNHWPSRRGGEDVSEQHRINAANVLRKKVDEIFAEDVNTNIIIMGDFNDMPDNRSIKEYLHANEFDCDSTTAEPGELYNLATYYFRKGEGTYKHQSNWNMLDQMIISGSMLVGNDFRHYCKTFRIIKPDFLVSRNDKYKGEPYPTYNFSYYIGGFSDHFPVGALFKIVE